MLKISFVQPNFRQGPGGIAAYLPYSCGLLWAYALTRPLVAENIERHRFVYLREPLDQLAEELAKTDIVALSTYVWNRNYNFTLAKKIRELNPNILIVVGGPEPPVNKPDIFSKYMPWADLVVKREGEITFANLLEAFIRGESYDDIPGLLINKNLEAFNTGEGTRIQLLDEIPSPYTTGVFDHMLPLEKEWNATYETNRGCPFQCTFCDWGSLTYSKMKKFDLVRIFEELEWVGKNKIAFLDSADSNFGMFVERDNLIADKLIEVQKKYGYPYRTNWAWAKNQKNEVIKLSKKLIDAGTFNNGLTISLQTLDDNTLKVIKRNNLEINKIQELFEECQKNGVPLNNELILGLPGETAASWANTLYKLIEVGQHDGLEAWQCQILENAEMNLLQRKLYELKTQTVIDYFSNGGEAYEAQESVEIVISTSTMTQEEMVQSYCLYWFLLTWHMGGLSQFAARFLHKYSGVSYEEFYTKLREFLKKDEYAASEDKRMYDSINHWYTTGERINHSLGHMTISAINIHFSTLFSMHIDDKISHYQDLVEEFVRSEFKDHLDQDLMDELLKFNRLHVNRHGDFDDRYATIGYNFLDYLIYNKDFVKAPVTYRIYFGHDRTRCADKNWYVESIYFSRRRGFGKNFLETVA